MKPANLAEVEHSSPASHVAALNRSRLGRRFRLRWRGDVTAGQTRLDLWNHRRAASAMQAKTS
jgi:hypothetical protein